MQQSHENGEGVGQDFHQARAWYEKAASQNDAQAQFDLGVMNELGQGGSINLKQARTWFGLACNNGHKEGCERYENN
ncbi:tetratricopeptide repeat protein [Klebsiella pneumoniae]|uniref:tetratricopeptide repeat protein n=1 Tax=Klebsiella pneumoniae TaxID=573 RepID=UPI003F621132